MNDCDLLTVYRSVSIPHPIPSHLYSYPIPVLYLLMFIAFDFIFFSFLIFKVYHGRLALPVLFNVMAHIHSYPHPLTLHVNHFALRRRVQCVLCHDCNSTSADTRPRRQGVCSVCFLFGFAFVVGGGHTAFGCILPSKCFVLYLIQ